LAVASGEDEAICAVDEAGSVEPIDAVEVVIGKLIGFPLG
jgi:hypothetical protein